MKKAHLRELKRITDSIPKELLSRLTKKELQSPTLKFLVDKALEDPKTPKEDRQRFQAMKDAGHLDKMVEVVDNAVEKEIDEYLHKEIEKAKKLGRLPKVAPKLILKKGKKYANKEHKKLKAGEGASASGVGKDSGDKGDDGQSA